MSSPREPETSERFGRYVLLETLAKGGMAQIYKAATPNGKIFTLKKILADYSSNSDFIKMFLDEAKISLNLKHDNVVRVLDFGQFEGNYFLAMEYVFGRDVGTLLRTSVERRIYVPLDVACMIIMQCAQGLAYAHSLVDNFGKPQGVIHRDISPPNILVSYNGDSKVLDFGIAKAARTDSRVNTRSGVLKGKFSYMSPEQALGQPLNPSSDQFSLGIVFYELLTSRSLFYSQDEIETLERVRKADVSSPRKIRKDIPPELEKIVLRALERKEKNRFSGCAEFAESLRRFLKQNYPRTDARTVAKFVRALFPEDFQRRSRPALKEGWVDILVSGASDDDLLLDRSLGDADAMKSNPGTKGYRLNVWDRLLYDPRLGQKMSRIFVQWGVPLLIVCALSLLWMTGWLEERWKTVHEAFKTSETPVPPVAAPTVQPQPTPLPTENLDKKGLAYWLLVSEKAEAEGRYEEAASALSKAHEINPLDPKLVVKKLFLNLSTGNFDEACRAIQQTEGASDADRSLAIALCAEARGDTVKALSYYSEFIQRFPADPRRARAASVLDALKSGVDLPK